MKRIATLFLALLMVLSLAACAANQPDQTTPSTQATTATEATPSTAPVSGVAFTVVVKDLEGKETTFQYTSDKKTVGEALLAEGLIAGDEGEYGLYVTSVNGVSADWDKDQTYWAFYINGEYATTGVDATDIVEGTTYSLILTKG